MKKTYRGVVLDLDGTMLDTEKMNIIPLQRLVKEELGQDISYEALCKYTGYAGKKTLAMLGFENVEKSYQKWVDYINRADEKAVLYDGWHEVMETLAERGYLCAVASSKLRSQYRIDFGPTGLEKHMKALVLAEDTTEHKPHPMPLLKAAQMLDISPAELIYVGDTAFDAEASRQAGMDFALALWGASDKSIAADYKLTEPLQLLAILK